MCYNEKTKVVGIIKEGWGKYMLKIVKRYYEEEKEAIEELDKNLVNEIAYSFKKVKEKGNVFICGNGGSASAASHFFNDLIKGAHFKYTNVFCLTDNIPLLTAVSNDIDYQSIFTFPTKNNIKTGDLIFCITTSGNSKNVVKLCEYAKSVGAVIISVTGDYESEVKKYSDITLKIKSRNCRLIEDVQLSVCHCIVESLVEGE